MAKFKQIGIDVQVYKLIETNRLSFSETENDILHRMLLKSAPQTKIKTSAIPTPEKLQVSRKRGSWKVIIAGRQILAANMVDAYREMLLALASDNPTFLDQFSKQRGRTRLFISKVPSNLYADASAHLAAECAKELISGWYYDSNLSKEQVVQRARAAATVAGLRYGVDLQIMEDGVTI